MIQSENEFGMWGISNKQALLTERIPLGNENYIWKVLELLSLLV